jgi:hypothetical protein
MDAPRYLCEQGADIAIPIGLIGGDMLTGQGLAAFRLVSLIIVAKRTASAAVLTRQG